MSKRECDRVLALLADSGNPNAENEARVLLVAFRNKILE